MKFEIFCRRPLVALLLGLAALPLAAQSSDVDLVLSNGSETVTTLEVGRSLSAQVTGLPAGEEVEITVRDDLDWPVVSAAAVANAAGAAEVPNLWESTGIVGCDCDVVATAAYTFRRAEAALRTLVGEGFEVVVTDSTGTEVAATGLTLVAPSSPIAFPADATGCPRTLLQDAESLYLLVLGGSAGTLTDATVAPGGDGPIVEVRQNQPEGPTFLLGGTSPELWLLWPGPQTNPGGYRVFVDGPNWPPLLDIGGGPINTGVVVEDHTCPPSDPPTEE